MSAQHTAAPRYRERTIRCFGSAESGPFAELDNGDRVYEPIIAAAPALLAACVDLLAAYEADREELPARMISQANAARAVKAKRAARVAIAKAKGTP